MKKNFTYLFVLIYLIVGSSCKSVKDISMFQESENDIAKIHSIPPPPELRIKTFDNLYIKITTLDTEVNRIFNPSSVGEGYSSGTTSNYGDPASQYINGYRISEDSTITLPLLGKINLVGLNLKEAEERVKSIAEVYLKDPAIQIKFLNYRVNIVGELRNPGIYYNYEGSINMFDAIGKASGITEYADLKHVVVKRENMNGIQTFNIDLTNNSVYDSDAFYLHPNDLVYIPPSNLKRRNTNSDTYTKFLETISAILVAAALFIK